MYEGIGLYTKIDSEFEYCNFIETIDIKNNDINIPLDNILKNMFYGVMRLVLGYTWLKDYEHNIPLKDICINYEIKQDDNGKFKHDILGRWTIIISAEIGNTKESTLFHIEKVMERYIRTRFNIKEPETLEVVLLENKRKEIISECFTDYYKEE